MSISESDVAKEIPFQVKRPKRLWVVALMNILVGLLSLMAVSFLAISERVPASLQLSPSAALLSSLGGAFLVATSCAALYGNPRAPRFMLGAAFFFYGGIIAQNIQLLVTTHGLDVPTQKFVANVLRSSLELALNVWALRSLKSKQFFASRLLPPAGKV